MALFGEFLLVPYTFCTNIEDVLNHTLTYEWIIDVIWLINIIVSFCTPFTRDVDRVNKCGEIAEKYIKGAFFFDLLSTLPCVCTLYSYQYIEWTYYTKILRVYHFLQFKRILQNNIVNPIVNSLKLSKQTKGKINFLLSMIVNLSFVMHVIACLWLKVGHLTYDTYENERYNGSWITDLSEEQQ